MRLAVDAVSCVWALQLLWHHNLLLGCAVAVLPPVGATVLLGASDLDSLRRSPLGRYARRYLTAAAQACRWGAYAAAAAGAWTERPWLLAGALVVLLAVLLRGVAWPRRMRAGR